MKIIVINQFFGEEIRKEFDNKSKALIWINTLLANKVNFVVEYK
jgi:hypothetical protein